MPNQRLETDLRAPLAGLAGLVRSGSALCGVVPKSYMTILHCLADEIYLELLG